MSVPTTTDPRRFRVPAGVSAPPPTPETSPPPRRRRRRRRIGVLVALALVAAAVGLGVPTARAWWAWRGIERLALDDALGGAGSGTNYLLVGTDSRADLDPAIDNAPLIFGDGVAGERTDTIAVLHLGGDGARLLAVPRDLYVPLDGGAPSRINAAYSRGGPAALVRTVRAALDIPIDHYVEVDFAGFLGLVDALGGVTVTFDHPAYDPKSGLDVAVAGPVRLDAVDALAYVRSRDYHEILPDGSVRRDPTADLGRVQRQQRFLAAVFDELATVRNPWRAAAIVDEVADDIRLDDRLGFLDALRLAWRLRGLDPETATLPVTPFTTASGAAVLDLRTDEAQPLLNAFR
ncbi:MAG: LytR family transcriptional regulator [Actinomyces sp.]|nr:MAG: LytR family transcriptional regulator [Actinomyces sp.]